MMRNLTKLIFHSGAFAYSIELCRFAPGYFVTGQIYKNPPSHSHPVNPPYFFFDTSAAPLSPPLPCLVHLLSAGGW